MDADRTGALLQKLGLVHDQDVAALAEAPDDQVVHVVAYQVGAQTASRSSRCIGCGSPRPACSARLFAARAGTSVPCAAARRV